MKVNMRLAIIILFFMVGCRSTREIQVVDKDGKPLEDAIICQWNLVKAPFPHLFWKTKLYKTNSDGKAIISNRLDANIGKIGYFPIYESCREKEKKNVIILYPFKQDFFYIGPWVYYLDSTEQIGIYRDWLDYEKWLHLQPGGKDLIQK